jgi:sugar lactone lactonase YvrE
MKRLLVCAAVVALGLAGCGKGPAEPKGAGDKAGRVCKCGKVGCANKAGCACSKRALKTPRLGIDLSGQYKNPDGMTIKDGAVWLSINNTASGQPSCIAKITPDDRVEKIIDLPAHPETGVSSALGLVFASDGNLYVSDNQNLAGKGMGKSRLLRVAFEGGKAARVEVVAVGLHAANGIAAKGDSVYVNETTFGEGDPMDSGTYRFKLAELKADAPVTVDGTLKDPHVIFTLKTRGPVKVGANGLCFDGEGNLCVANFGDQEIWKVSFDEAGAVKGSALFTKVTCAESVDGLQYDGEGSLWFADFLGNAIVRVCAKSGQAEVVAKNPPCDGHKGELDSPSECIRLGEKVYVSNIDLTFGPHQADEKQTISIIDL